MRGSAVFYPTGPAEQVFQIYFRGPERPETWRTMTPDEGAIECADLARRLECVGRSFPAPAACFGAVADGRRADGWADSFLQPLRSARAVIRVGLRARDPLPSWHKGRVVLLGDAAHPPVPFIGQGAMMAIEDAGVLSLLLQRMCVRDGRFVPAHWAAAMQVYEAQRLPRTTAIYRSSHALGRMQAARTDEASNGAAAAAEEKRIREAVAQHGTLPELQAASSFDCQAAAAQAAVDALRSESARARL
jgi:salicylate hydroxylase